MKNKISQFMPPSRAVLEPPAYPKCTNEVVRKLKKAMDKAECRPKGELTLERFGRLLGAPKSTIHDWYHGILAKPIMHLLCGLERLSEAQRTEMFRGLCRECPRLQHPRLARDQEAVHLLDELLAKPAGLTLVTGPSDALRTFVITALGNSAAQITPAKTVCGLDIHRPDVFVPVPEVHYFQNPGDSAQARQLIGQLWKGIECSTSDLILLNRVWTIMPEIRERIISVAKSRHVILADQFDARALPRHRGNLLAPNIVTVTSGFNQQIHVIVESRR